MLSFNMQLTVVETRLSLAFLSSCRQLMYLVNWYMCLQLILSIIFFI